MVSVSLSPNYEPRRDNRSPDMIIIHYTGMPNADESLKRLCDPLSRVSAHYLIDESGGILRLVSEEMCAWHAGKSYWRGKQNINNCSIGIELQNPGHEFGYRAFPESQTESLINLIKDIRKRYIIPDVHVLGHSDIAPERKQDPGELFPWQKLAKAGIGIWHDQNLSDLHAPKSSVDSSTATARLLQDKLFRLGYSLQVTGNFDLVTNQTLTAFYRHWAPGLLNIGNHHTTLKILESLLLKIDKS